MSDQFKKYLFYVSSVLLLLSAALYITGWFVIPYIYAVASAGVAVAYLTSPYRGDDARLKRLNIQEAIAAVLLPVSSFLMFNGKNEWVVFLLVSAILQLYVAFVKGKVDGKNNQSSESENKEHQ